MSKQTNGKMLKGKDLITIGIFSAIYFVINFAFMLMGGLSTPTRKCRFSPEWNDIFRRSACGWYASLITRYLPV